MKKFELSLHHLCHSGYIDEVWLLKTCGDIHWSYCNISDNLYQSFIFLSHNINLTQITKTIEIFSSAEFYSNYVESNHLVNGQPLKLISVPVEMENYKLKRIKKESSNRPDLSKFRSMKNLKFKVEFEDHYKTNQYRDYNAVEILYFANFIRIENEYLGAAKYGRESSFYQNVQPNNFIFCQGNANNFKMEYENKIMFSSTRKVQLKTDQEDHLSGRQVLAQHLYT